VLAFIVSCSLLTEAAAMAMEDAHQTRQVMRELCRRYVDMTQIDVHVVAGVCYMRGVMAKLRNHPEIDLESEAEIIQKILRQKPGIRGVVWEVRARGN